VENAVYFARTGPDSTGKMIPAKTITIVNKINRLNLG